MPIKNNRIILINFSGKGYGDNLKYIAEELKQKKIEIIWPIKNGVINDLPKFITPIKMYSINFFVKLATSKIIVSNSRLPVFVKKRHKQVYIQTWHGSLPIKKIEYDAYDKLDELYKLVMKKDTPRIDYMISNSDFCTNMYRSAFKFNGNIVEYGSPRNDILIQKENHAKIKKNINKTFNIATRKFILYAPTFRKDYSNNPYDIDFINLKKMIEQKTGEKWSIVIKLHPIIKNAKDYITNYEKLIDATKYSDIQELICSCDLLITDYSSIMFEGMMADKPVIIYANDIDSYLDERGLYVNMNELPFPIAQNNKELKEIIKNNKFNDIINNYSKYKNKIGLKESGQAAKKTANLIISLIRKEDKNE